VCFRYAPAGLAPESLDAVNREILQRVQEQGIAVPSGTIVQGHFAIRAAITNHRSRREDFDALIAAVAGFGNDIAKEPV
jgi:aromatic-L-amino-acid/L-tryptophan decarboxylase